MTDKGRLTAREGCGDQRGWALTIQLARPERHAGRRCHRSAVRSSEPGFAILNTR